MSEEHTSRDVDRLTVRVVEGDITAEEVDALVNAANDRLQHGGGVAKAIADAGGASIQQESDAWVEEHGRLAPGEAAITGAGELPAGHVIHVVGPVYDEDADGNEDELRAAVEAALDAAADLGARSVAFPAISAGTYGYPRDEATRVIVRATAARAAESGDLEEVRLVGFDSGTAEDFAAAVDEL
jgi:O-acetyl-ADP-ribose deacetylase